MFKKTGQRRRMVYFLALFQILGLISSVHAILKTRTPQGAIAWVVSLNALSVVAVPAYWVFGRSKFNGYIEAWKDESLNLTEKKAHVNNAFRDIKVEVSGLFPEYNVIKSLSTSPVLSGNSVQLLVDGAATYQSLEEGIKSAQSYILFQFYILRADNTGTHFKNLLIERAKAGVAVYVLYDELGSSELKSQWISGLLEVGAKVVPFNTRQGPQNRFQYNFRNHRKIVVVDGKSTWLGGLNIGDDYLGKDKKLSPWRDTHLRIDGPAAVAAQSIFWSDWHWADKTLIEGLSWTPEKACVPEAGAASCHGQEVLVLGSGPADELETASLFFSTAINSSRKRIWIATPYFIPDRATMLSLRLALLRGVEVRILTPKLNDNWFVRHAANVYLSELLQMGAKIYFYQKGFMHQKVMLVDDLLSLVGTVNFDNRSFRLNFEVTGAIAGREFAGEIEKMLLQDFSHSKELVDYNLEDQNLWERLKAHASALLAPVL